MSLGFSDIFNHEERNFFQIVSAKLVVTIKFSSELSAIRDFFLYLYFSQKLFHQLVINRLL